MHLKLRAPELLIAEYQASQRALLASVALLRHENNLLRGGSALTDNLSAVQLAALENTLMYALGRVRKLRAGKPEPPTSPSLLLTLLYKDLLMHIVGMLDLQSVLNVRCVCRQLRAVGDDEQLWKLLCGRLVDLRSLPRQPVSWREHFRFNLHWSMLEESLASLVVCYEQGLRWTAVNEANWRIRRPAWLAQLMSAAPLSVVSACLLELEQNVLPGTFTCKRVR